MKINQKAILRETINFFAILSGSVLYALGTVLFIFPASLLLGGTSGISVILTHFLGSTPGLFLTVINTLLLVLAIIILGSEMAIKNLVGSVLTTGAIALFEKLYCLSKPIIGNMFISAVVGALIISVASGIMFYFNSSGGGTDIIALIIRKYSGINIGKALLISDVLIVIVGGILSGYKVAISSFSGLLVKTLGIDFVISAIGKFKTRNTKP